MFLCLSTFRQQILVQEAPRLKKVLQCFMFWKHKIRVGCIDGQKSSLSNVQLYFDLLLMFKYDMVHTSTLLQISFILVMGRWSRSRFISSEKHPSISTTLASWQWKLSISLWFFPQTLIYVYIQGWWMFKFKYLGKIKG